MNDCPRSCPTSFPVSRTTSTFSLDANSLKIIEGISSALMSLIDAFSNSSEKPWALFEEYILDPIHDPDLLSFCMTENLMRDGRQLRMVSIQRFLEQLASMLDIDMRELVLAYMIVERVVRRNREVLQYKTVRLIFLTAVSIVMKVIMDCEWCTADTLESICDLVPGIDCHDFAKMEWKLLSCLDYSVPAARIEMRESCVMYTVALMEAAGVIMSEQEADAILDGELSGLNKVEVESTLASPLHLEM